MCGRFTLKTNPSEWGQLLLPNLDMESLQHATAHWQPRYNIAPTQSIVGLISPGDPSETKAFIAARAFAGARAVLGDDLSIGNRMINARVETLSEKPAFRTALARHRCAIPADGYYEWQVQGKRKQPFWIHKADSRLFAFAGLWDRNRKASDQEVTSATIVTGNAPDLLSPIHDRMPVILSGEALRTWLDPATSATDAHQLLLSKRDTELLPTPVGTHVNNPRHEDAKCLQPPDSQPGEGS